MSEYESKSLIEAYGIPVFPTATAATVDEAVLTAEQLGFPVVMKILSRNTAHNTGVGGVRLKLENAADVRHGFDDILASARAACPGATIDGVTLQPTIIDPHYELFLGAKKDPDFGPVIRFGAGGILAELLDDRAVALPPLNRLLAARLMEGTRVDRLFKDHRNHLPVDRERLEGILISLSQLVTDFPEIAELDINPLVILKGRPMAVDVRVVLEPKSSPAPMHLAISPYPAHHEATVQLPGMGELLIRPIRPEDAPLLSELFETLSPQSIYYRFFSPIKQISPATLARFTQIDYDREIALVAIQGSFPSEKLLGAARVILQRNLKDAEFSVLVGDPWQGKGIGAHLLATCLGIARERRFGKIWGAVMPENKGMLALGRKLGFTIARAGLSGEYNLTVDLAGSTYRQPHRPESKEEVSHEDNR
jgi:acetyltransferase